MLKISGSGNSIIIDSPSVPASESSDGEQGQLAYDYSYLYVRVYDPLNHLLKWRKIALSAM